MENFLFPFAQYAGRLTTGKYACRSPSACTFDNYQARVLRAIFLQFTRKAVNISIFILKA